MPEANAPHPPVHIALVGDDPAVLHSLSFALRLDRFEVSAYAGAAAFPVAPQPQPWACAIIDQDMPGITGLDAAKALRERGSTLPLILISGDALPWLGKRAPEAGFLAPARASARVIRRGDGLTRIEPAANSLGA